jgi:hypothetical protein
MGKIPPPRDKDRKYLSSSEKSQIVIASEAHLRSFITQNSATSRSYESCGHATLPGIKPRILHSIYAARSTAFFKHNLASYKEPSSREYCILILELRYTNARFFFSIRKHGYITTQRTVANLQEGISTAAVSNTRLLNRPSCCCLSADLPCADWSLARFAVNCSQKHYSNCKENAVETTTTVSIARKSFFIFFYLTPNHIFLAIHTTSCLVIQ